MFYARKHVSKAVQDACRPLRKSIKNNIISDERLRVLIRLDLDGVERSAKRVTTEDGALIDCIGYLIKLSGHLLGYDADRGKAVRHLFYFYNKHRYRDFSLLNPGINPPAYNKREELISQMWKDGMNVEEIAGVMNLAARSVNSVLLRIRDAEEASARGTKTDSLPDERTVGDDRNSPLVP